MTVLELFDRLKEKGYKPGFVIGCDPGRAWYADAVKRELELDRREVFRAWYGEDWRVRLALAHQRIDRWVEGEEADDTIGYILSYPNP